MAPKYIKGQEVTIISVKDQHMHVKHPKFEPLVSKSGTILDYYSVPLKDLLRDKGLDLPRDMYFYTVYIDGEELESIPEECLEPMC